MTCANSPGVAALITFANFHLCTLCKSVKRPGHSRERYGKSHGGENSVPFTYALCQYNRRVSHVDDITAEKSVGMGVQGFK